MISVEEVTRLIKDGLPEAEAVVLNEYDDGEHFAAEVTSSAFDGLSLIKQHRLVYQALGDAMHSRIHALQLKTYPPNRWPHKK